MFFSIQKNFYNNEIVFQFKQFRTHQNQIFRMDIKPVGKKPTLSSQQVKKQQKPQNMFRKISLFFRYRIPLIYRQLRMPIYQNLLKTSNKNINNNVPKNSVDNYPEILFKQVTLNSKYHHRQKMRFSRTPLLKYLKYDFARLESKLKSKSYMKIYDDLEDDDQDKEQKKEYEVDSHFSQQALQKYKKKHKIEGRIVSSHGYEDIKERLISEHGWTQNKDVTSLMFDFKYMSKKKDIDYVNLLDRQVVNHFEQNKNITAKFGLTRNIRNIVSLGKDPSQFFPRCYDVNDVAELQNFYEDFKMTQVQAILKDYLVKKGAFPHAANLQVCEKTIEICLCILQRQFLTIEEKLSWIVKDKPLYILQKEWQLIEGYMKNVKMGSSEQNQKVNEKLLHQVQKVCEFAQQNDPQWHLNNINIWIIKPASMSRGRGIKTFNDLNEILDYVIGKQISWVAQKYIERPLILRKRKFDIRQWVLLTDFKPFRVWVYQQCYVRFCAEEYTSENLKNRKIHLTNNSVTKGQTILHDGIQDNMMSQAEFSEELQKLEGQDIFKKTIRPQINKIAIQSLQSVKENIVSRKSTLQILGYDFMIDENYKVWLIQVNSSPTMEHSTKTTQNIVRKGMSDFADLVQNYMFGGKYYNGAKASKLYGGWKLLTNK